VTYQAFNPRRNPYPAAIAECDHFVVTSDSVSMISELICTGKPVDVFELPERRLKLKWRASSGIRAWLSRSGVLQPPRDVRGMVRMLIEKGYVSVLGKGTLHIPFSNDDTTILRQLNILLKS
jgi:hypothetical protein